MGERIRGRAGQALLKRRRALFPTCAVCAAQGIVRAATQIDHVLALALGGEDVDENCQGLCDLHHAIKTALESASTGGAANHPDWLQPARCRVTLVSGPPCGGKSTFVATERRSADLVVDLDDIAEQLQPGFDRRWNSDLLNRAVRVRNALLGSLARMSPTARAFVIVSAPTEEEVRWWQGKLQPARSVRLDPGLDVCTSRAARRGGLQTVAVAAWYERARQPWRPDAGRLKRQAFGVDGYPEE